MPGAANPQAFNRYSYVLGNPLKYTDPSGHGQCQTQEDCDDMGTTPMGTGSTGSLVISGGNGGGGPHDDDDIDPNPNGVTLPIPTLSTAETIGLVTTGVLLTAGATIAEFTLLILGIAMLDAGPLGVVADLAFIVPAELLILDVEVGVDRYIYDVVTSGTREGHEPEFILIPIAKDLIGH